MQSKANVLIVDDEEFIRRILSRIVSREGYGIGEAVDGASALKEMRRMHYDYVISDIRMPNLDGVQLTTRIKDEHPDVKVVLITAYPGECSEEDARAAGADRYITKPFKNAEIAGTLGSLWDQPRHQE